MIRSEVLAVLPLRPAVAVAGKLGCTLPDPCCGRAGSRWGLQEVRQDTLYSAGVMEVFSALSCVTVRVIWMSLSHLCM